MLITITSSPSEWDDELPWSYTEDHFLDWVYEVFQESKGRPLKLEAALAMLDDFQYTFTIEN